ncbi:hypothetical protein GCM10022419_005930 [Nonomuraea rosea]|uniref:Epoxide hydrolase n=1 Tax=Nonomuraea rosea TaxID=638574 RepID=A0ABP6V9T0_9ACTN
MPTVSPVIEVSDADLRATRVPEPWPVGGWQAGTDVTELRRLVTHWASGSD